VDPVLQHLLLERLAAEDPPLGESAVDLVLAATEGREELEASLSGEAPARTVEAVQPELEATPPGAYLARIAVQGFRGVAGEVGLDLAPGPGLTLVVGRNGSGKSSFAEGLELLMTGANHRWEKRTKVWKEGWQNLHFTGDTVLTGELQVDGRAGHLRLRRTWEHGAALAPGECVAVAGDGGAVSLDELGWPAALARYRPFLSYNELGSMFDDNTTMYDALAAILGLEDVEDLQATIRAARLERERGDKAVRAEVKELLEGLEGVEDERAAVVAAALRAAPVEFDAIELALEGVGEEGDPGAEMEALRALASLGVPEPVAVDAAFDALTVAREDLAGLAGTDAAHAASLVELLEAALRHDEAHQEPDCPVCGTAGMIDERWRARTAQEIGRLASESRRVEDAQAAVAAAQRRVSDLLAPRPPAAVARARDLGLDPGPLEVAWERWAAERVRSGEAGAEAALRGALAGVAEAAEALAGAAGAELDRREDAWRPVARRLGEWLPPARRAARAALRLKDLKAAEAWVKEAAADLQELRLAPIAEAAKENWAALRQESNVSLDGFRLRRSGNMRSAAVEVTVDGSDASAFGVMSQGELHALAVSIFLPRAALPESPFRFLVIDDPVQSMDPAKVDGLARVLERAAQDRQVVVFTHDERLAEAVRRLNVEATVLGVTRRPLSKVEVRRERDPVERYLDDARALLKEDDLPADVALRVVPGFCRHALEAACVTAVRRRRLGRGDPHAKVEEDIASARKLNSHLSLALFDVPDRGGDVLSVINSRFGRPKGDAVRAANRGAHEGLEGDLRDFVQQSALLAREIAALP